MATARYLTLLLFIGLVAGCTEDGARDMLSTYAERIGNAIEEPVQVDLAQALSQQPALPAKRVRLHALETASEGLLDVLDFRRCGVMQLIAERNSSLGRLAGDSQRLIYELQLLPRLRQCLQQLTTTAETEAFRRRLEELIALKQRNLPKLVWNALYASAEMEQHFALNSAPLPLASTDGQTRLLEALRHFALLSELSRRDDWQTPTFTETLEQDYEALYRSAFGAQWLTSLLLLTHTLERTADALERRLARRPVCFRQQPNNQARIIRNVFQRFYGSELQPYLAQVHRQGQAWLEVHRRILQPLPTPAGSQAFMDRALSLDHPDSLWQQYIRARNRHTQGWQRLLQQCGLMPGTG